MAPNPAVLQLDDRVTLACCSTDVLRHLSSMEVVRLQQPVHRLVSLASHLLAQQRLERCSHCDLACWHQMEAPELAKLSAAPIECV